MMNNEEFLKLVARKVAADPRLIGDVVKTCMGKWDAYVEHIGKRREAEHLSSVSGAIQAIGRRRERLYDSIEMPLLMDAVAFAFPAGFDSAACKADAAFLGLFVESARGLGWEPESAFVRDVRGFDGMLGILYRQYDERKSED